MSAPAYKKLTVDLTVAHDKEQLVAPNVEINGVTVLVLAAGSDLRLHFGNQEDVPMFQGDSWDLAVYDVDGCTVRGLDEGLFVSNAVGAGTAVVLVSYGPPVLGGTGGGVRRT